MKKKVFINNFSVYLALMIQDNGMTQKEVAEMAGISEASLSGYINQKRLPDIATLTNLVNVLECSYEDLLGNYPFIEDMSEREQL